MMIKTPSFDDLQGQYSRPQSLTLIPLKISSPVLVMINSMSVPICNRFYARQDIK